ncbi:hypothetical protein CMK22_03380 [Candidatus Poribacteria bacterium]|nr:hypothetical protein [Candidatus Poribacteria bacterium]
MAKTTNQEIIEFWRDKPAPLLSVLHDFHDRDGFISDEVMRQVSVGLKIPLAELFGTVTFYHHFSRTPPGQEAPRVCMGPVCLLRGSKRILDQLEKDGAVPMPCAGRCDDTVPVLKMDQVLTGLDSDTLSIKPSPLPEPNPGGVEECIFASIRERNRSSIQGYQKFGGYKGVFGIVGREQPAEVIDLISQSQLAGRGGAGFPTGLKWKSVAEAENHPKTVVCNADEGEPGCFKDRAILDYDPHAVIEGMIIAAYATGATRGFIYLRYEYPETFKVLECAITEARNAGLLGDRILGKEFSFEIYLRRGAGAYICGEEGALLNSLEGKRPFPRNRPPYPVTHGFENLPTVVNNVETLAAVAPIVNRGAEWYRNLGIDGHAGTKVISLSGDVRKPGNYEVPIGLPLKTLLYDWANGPVVGRSIQAVTMAGVSGGFLAGEDLNITLDDSSIKSKGSYLGSGGIIVFDDSRDMVEIACNIMKFYAEESCGKCFPCRIGTQRLVERLEGKAGPKEVSLWLEEVEDIGETMQAISACGLGISAPLITGSLIRYFPDQVVRHAESGKS